MRIAELAGAQHGRVSTAQLRAAGLGTSAIALRVQRGRLHRVHRGVYAVGRVDQTAEGAWMAAVLACGGRAVLSHISAAALWKLTRWIPGPSHVTVPLSAHRHRRVGIKVHRSRHLPPRVITQRRGIPVTAAARTLIDFAEDAPRRHLERAIEEADRLRVCTPAELAAVAAEHPGRAGAGQVSRILALQEIGNTLTNSELEEAFLALCREHSLGVPVVNAPVEGLRVDFLWPAERLIVETDGWESHRTRAAYERDRERDALLSVRGYLVVRFTYRQVITQPKVVATRLRSLLRARRGQDYSPSSSP